MSTDRVSEGALDIELAQAPDNELPTAFSEWSTRIAVDTTEATRDADAPPASEPYRPITARMRTAPVGEAPPALPIPPPASERTPPSDSPPPEIVPTTIRVAGAVPGSRVNADPAERPVNTAPIPFVHHPVRQSAEPERVVHRRPARENNVASDTAPASPRALKERSEGELSPSPASDDLPPGLSSAALYTAFRARPNASPHAVAPQAVAPKVEAVRSTSGHIAARGDIGLQPLKPPAQVEMPKTTVATTDSVADEIAAAKIASFARNVDPAMTNARRDPTRDPTTVVIPRTPELPPLRPATRWIDSHRVLASLGAGVVGVSLVGFALWMLRGRDQAVPAARGEAMTKHTAPPTPVPAADVVQKPSEAPTPAATAVTAALPPPPAPLDSHVAVERAAPTAPSRLESRSETAPPARPVATGVASPPLEPHSKPAASPRPDRAGSASDPEVPELELDFDRRASAKPGAKPASNTSPPASKPDPSIPHAR